MAEIGLSQTGRGERQKKRVDEQAVGLTRDTIRTMTTPLATEGDKVLFGA